MIHDVIREPGSICKIKVQASLKSDINALACCIGKNGSRVKRIENVLCGEKVSFIDSNADIKQQLIQTLYPSRLSENDIVINNIDGKDTACIKTDEKNIGSAIGRNGSNIRTAEKILGMKIEVEARRNEYGFF